MSTNNIFTDNYDTLLIATGAFAVKPPVIGVMQPQVFFLRTVRDALAIHNFIEDTKPQNAVIAGSGFIGMELLESLKNKHIHVTMVELANQITLNLDKDMAEYLKKMLEKKNMHIITRAGVLEIKSNSVTLTNGTQMPADMVIMATGVKPNVTLAKNAGIELGETGAIKVDKTMQTNSKDIYAAGDCIETYSAVTKKPVYRPLGSTANKTGRIAGDCMTGGKLEYRGNLGTGIFKVFDISVASTGLSEKEAKSEGFEVTVCHNIKPNKPEYMGGSEMVIKAIGDKKTGRLLGVQIIGNSGVDKRIDVFATLITYKATVDDLVHLDLAYAPPFSTTKDPVHYTGMILDNAISGGRELVTTQELLDSIESKEDVQIIDARSAEDYEKKGHIKHAKNIPHNQLRQKINTLDKNKKTITYCNKGVTGNAVQNILLENGFKKVYNLSGGHTIYKGSKK